MKNPYSAPAHIEDAQERQELPLSSPSRPTKFIGVVLAITSALMVGYALLVLVMVARRVDPKDGWMTKASTGVSAFDIVCYLAMIAAGGIAIGIVAFLLMKRSVGHQRRHTTRQASGCVTNRELI